MTHTNKQRKERKMSGIKRLGYSKKEAVEATTLSLRSIDNLIATGKLKAMKAGSRVIISADSLESFIKKGTMKLRGVKDPRSPEGKDIVIQMMPEVAKLFHALPRKIDCPTVFYHFPKTSRLCKLFKQWTAETGVEGLSWRRLRNTGISRMYESGMAENVIHSQVGHSSREITKRYNCPSEDYKKRELQKYNNSLPTDTTTDTRVMGN